MRNLKYWAPAVLWMLVIYYLSSRTGNELGSMFPFLDSFNWGHFVAYFILCLLIYFALVQTGKNKNTYFWSIIFSISYGITDEFHQAFVPSRTPDIFDLANDGLGALLAMLFVHQYRKRKCRNLVKETD